MSPCLRPPPPAPSPARVQVKALTSDSGKQLEEAGPSAPVQILGLSGVPGAGDVFEVCASESEARSRAEEAATRLRLERLQEQAGGGSKVTLANLKEDWDSAVGDPVKLNVILKVRARSLAQRGDAAIAVEQTGAS